MGNLVAGGTGKTPAVILIAGLLRDAGYKPAVLNADTEVRIRGREGCLTVINILSGSSDAADKPS